MQAVILAGGIGSRLKPFTEIIPKPLLPIGEKSVLEIQISKLAEYGFKDIYFAERPDSERLITKKLELRGVNKMRDWRESLKKYIDNYYQDYI